ncbi:hypothetical protein [Ferrimonas marina]|uniref:Uncharacterized protein n=1 Tax=Ferrimonas marina TaxID=299255 RepID=A0A1M5NY43_9GAMM|nr:hypothetical protein [Ferrimonas marina]SHG94494.1 hypothetical protein SAMN02745129_1222 [Ferrimonas marina]
MSNPVWPLQRGAATLLLMLLVGAAAMSSALGVMSKVRSNQAQSLAFQGVTQSQGEAWRGAELVRRYLLTSLEVGEYAEMVGLLAQSADGPLDFQFSGQPNLSAQVIAYDSALRRATVDLTARTGAGTAATSTSTLRLVYQLSEQSPLSGGLLAHKLSFNGDLNVNSNIVFENQTEQGMTLFVKDFVGINTLDIKGFHKLEVGTDFATHSDLTLEGVREIHANGDVQVKHRFNSKGGDSLTLRALGSICDNRGYLNGGDMLANDTIYSKRSDDTLGLVQAQGDGGTSLVSYPNQGQLCSNSHLIELASPADQVLAPDCSNVALNGGSACSASSALTPVKPVHGEEGFDAYAFRELANYAIYRQDGKTWVDVQDVSGIADGLYTLDGGTLNGEAGSATLCSRSCFDSEGNTFVIKDAENFNFNRGVVWVEGNLNFMGNGDYYATWLATGNIFVDGNHTFYSPNFIGQDGNGHRHDKDITGLEGKVPGLCTTVNGSYPSNFCLGEGFDYQVGGGLGNFALLAGSYDDQGNAVGGDITFKSNINAYGSLIAGNRVEFDSNINIWGIVSAQSNRNNNQHYMNSNINIIVDEDAVTVVEGSGDGEGHASVVLLWSRYL